MKSSAFSLFSQKVGALFIIVERRLTLRDIAETLGLHYSTVSLALRGDSRIRKETRVKIEESARKLGYTPDPMVKALSVYRTALKASPFRATLAWLTNDDHRLYKPTYQFFDFFEGASQRAQELGYRLEEFAFRESDMSGQRFSKILRTRGISGILVAPQPLQKSRARIKIDWAQFSAVSFGYSLAWPGLHSVSNNQFSTVQAAVRQALKRGYGRIGLCLHKRSNDRVAGAVVGGFIAELMRRRNQATLPPLILPSGSNRSPASREAVLRWYHKERPDIVIASTNTLLQWILEFTEKSAPKELGTLSLNTTLGSSQSGIDQNMRAIGKAALELLVEMINRGERGIPPLQHRLLVEGTWNEGQTLRPPQGG